MKAQSLLSALAGAAAFFLLNSQPAFADDDRDDRWDCELKGFRKEDFDHLHHKDIFELPKEEPFCFEDHDLYWYNFARFDFSDTFVQGRLDYQEDNDDMSAVGGVVNESGVSQDFHIGYVSVRPDSHIHSFDLHSFRFFCMKFGIPVACTIGVSTARTLERYPGEEPILFNFTPPDSYPFAPQTATLPGDRSRGLKFAALGLPVVNFGAWDIVKDAQLYHRMNTHGVTLYVDDFVYDRWHCEDKTPEVILNGTMFDLGFGECQH